MSNHDLLSYLLFQLSENLFSVSCVRPPRGATLHHRQSANKLKKKTKVEVLDSNLVIADVTTPGLLEAAMEGMESVVLCTSAVPKVPTQTKSVVAAAEERQSLLCPIGC